MYHLLKLVRIVLVQRVGQHLGVEDPGLAPMSHIVVSLSQRIARADVQRGECGNGELVGIMQLAHQAPPVTPTVSAMPLRQTGC